MVTLACTPSKCCPSITNPLWDEWWEELLPQQQAHWSKLGWDEDLWDESIYKASTMAICYNSLTSHQLSAATSLCYDQEKWDDYMLDQFDLYCGRC